MLLNYCNDNDDKTFINSFNSLLEINKSKDILPNSTYIPINSELDVWLNNNVVYKWWIDSLHIPIHSLMPNPVSLKYDDFLKKILIYSNFYQVSIKDDGIRYGLYFCKDQTRNNLAFMMNRIGEKFIVKFDAPEDIYDGTVFDGEWIDQKNSCKQFKIFDIVAVYGNYIVQNCSFYDRLHVIKHLLEHFTIVYACANVELIIKPWLKLEEIQQLKFYFDEEKEKKSDNPYFWIQSKIKYDGLIFMPTLLPIGRGMQQNIYKWKQQHTIDLRLLVYSMEDLSNNKTKLLNVEFVTTINNNYNPTFRIDNDTKVNSYEKDNIKWNIYFQPLLLKPLTSMVTNNEEKNLAGRKKNITKKNLAQNSTDEFLQNAFCNNNVKILLDHSENQQLFKKIYQHISQKHQILLEKQKKEYDPDQPSYILDTSLEKMFVTWTQIDVENRLIEEAKLLKKDQNQNQNKVEKCIDLILECNFKRSKNNNNIYYLNMTKIRTDKFTPNPDYIIHETLKNQYENISFDQMENLIKSIPKIEVHNVNK